MGVGPQAKITSASNPFSRTASTVSYTHLNIGNRQFFFGLQLFYLLFVGEESFFHNVCSYIVKKELTHELLWLRAPRASVAQPLKNNIQD